ncbi:hypothetical protein RI367_000120 [Sorochytrium milnesiophthora]
MSVLTSLCPFSAPSSASSSASLPPTVPTNFRKLLANRKLSSSSQDKLQKLLDLGEKTSATSSPTRQRSSIASISPRSHSASPSAEKLAAEGQADLSGALAKLSLGSTSTSALPSATLYAAAPELRRQSSLSSLVATEQSQSSPARSNVAMPSSTVPQISASAEASAMSRTQSMNDMGTHSRDTSGADHDASSSSSSYSSNSTAVDRSANEPAAVPSTNTSSPSSITTQQAQSVDVVTPGAMSDASPLMKRRHSDFGPISPGKRDFSPSADPANWSIFGAMPGTNSPMPAEEIGLDVTRWVMVSNLPKTLSVDDLRVFREFGDVQYLGHKMLRAFGFIMLSFFDLRDSLKAVRKINRLCIKDQRLKAKFCDKMTFTEMSEIILADADCCSEIAITLLPASFEMEHLRDILQAFGDARLVRRMHDINGTVGLVVDFYDLREAQLARQGLAELIHKVYGISVLVNFHAEKGLRADNRFTPSSAKNRRIQTIKEESGYPDVGSLLDQSLLQSITQEQNSQTSPGHRAAPNAPQTQSAVPPHEGSPPNWSYAPSLTRRASDLSYSLTQQNMRREYFVNAANAGYEPGPTDRFGQPQRGYVQPTARNGRDVASLSNKTPELQTLLDDYFDSSSHMKAVMHAQRSFGGNSAIGNDPEYYRDPMPTAHMTGNDYRGGGGGGAGGAAGGDFHRPKQRQQGGYLSPTGTSGGGNMGGGGGGGGSGANSFSTCLRSNSVMPKVDFIPRENEFDIMRIMQGLDNRTTIMIRNIPNKYSQQMLIDFINETHRGKYDFLYLRMDFKNRCNVGYAFCNMVDTNSIVTFAQRVVGKKWTKFNSDKVCMISYANIQGKQALVDKFRNSSVMDEHPTYRPKIFYSSGPLCGEEEPFPLPTTRPRGGPAAMSSMSEEEYERSTSGHGSFIEYPYGRYSSFGGSGTGSAGTAGGQGAGNGAGSGYPSFEMSFSSYPNTPSTKKITAMDPWYQGYEYQTDVNLLSPSNGVATSAENSLPGHVGTPSQDTGYSSYHNRY